MSKKIKSMLKREYESRLSKVTDAVVVDFAGLESFQTAELRAHLRQHGVRVSVVANRLARKTLEGTPLAAMAPNLKGQSAILHGAEDVVQLSRALVEWRKKHKNKILPVKGAVVEGRWVDANGVTEISKLPGKKELRGKIACCIAGPLIQLASVIGAPTRSVVYALNARKDQLEKGQGAPAGG